MPIGITERRRLKVGMKKPVKIATNLVTSRDITVFRLSKLLRFPLHCLPQAQSISHAG